MQKNNTDDNDMDNRQNKEKKFWDKFANNYDAFIKNTVDKTYKSILGNIDSELNMNNRVLEIGTGTGIISFSICSKISSIIATDISPEMIQIAKLKQKESKRCRRHIIKSKETVFESIYIN